LLAGTGGLDIHDCEAELRDYVKSAGLEKNVVFLGAVQNVPEYLQAADLFVFPTENDAFPSSVIEAMACALPVITTPVGAIKSIVTDQESGVLVQPGDFKQLFEALHVMLADMEQAARFGEAAYRIVQERFSAGMVTGQYLSLFQGSLNVQGQE
jgi:glycosyltransferase involved in cell wall biosynthesis